ncbi:MAG: hypothetical protein NVSMB52_12600 [Chloroflexota bacterium]
MAGANGMKLIGILLVAMFGFPASAFAQPKPHPAPSGCKAPPHHPHKDKHPHKGKHPPPQCLAGTVMAVSGTEMQVQPAHGHSVRIIFVDKTIFQTDSGPGTLEGIMQGDFACVTATPHGHTFTAQLVVFDLAPFACRTQKPPPHSKSLTPDPLH